MSDLACVGNVCLKVVGPCSPNCAQEFRHRACQVEPSRGTVVSNSSDEEEGKCLPSHSSIHSHVHCFYIRSTTDMIKQLQYEGPSWQSLKLLVHCGKKSQQEINSGGQF